MLDSLPADLPVIYVFLMPLKSMLDMEGYWKKAAAVVLGHTDESVIQEYVADVLVGKAVADGRLSVAVADLFKPGDGVTITPKVSRIYRPEDYGMDSKYWKDRQDSHGRNQGEGLSWLSDSNLKDGKPVYDKSFGTFTYESDRKVERMICMIWLR